jgi:CheY-like chemotaxis protein
MPQGGRLTLRLRPRDGGVELAIEDTGEGMTDDTRERMFAPFFTGRPGRRLGLGLTLARSIIVRAGGRMEVGRDGARGTAVRVWLPAAVPTPSAEARDTAPAPAPPPKLEHATVLVLEDEEVVREALVETLTGAGHDVHCAADGREGLAKLEARAYDGVLADLALPERSGLVVARAVKRATPWTPVILITGWSHLLDPEQLREQGVDLMLVKPFRPERDLSVVADALRLHA